MLTTALFAFLSGIVTVLSPCVLPVLPFLLSGSVGGRLRPYGIVLGFVASFTAFTLVLSTAIGALGIPGDALRWVSVALLLGFGLTLFVSALHARFERSSSSLVANMQGTGVKVARDGFWGGVGVGATLGVLWTPCVGPIMAGVITLALNNAVTGAAVFTTLAFSLGTGLTMLLAMLGGRGLLAKVPWLVQRSAGIQRVFGVVMAVFAVGIAFNLDRQFQTWVLDAFPEYADALTHLENIAPVSPALEPPP
jgi:cytochrome c biogenesis protein CcdA